MNTCALKQKQSRLAVGCATTLMMLGLVGFSGQASACDTCARDWTFGLLPTFTSCDRNCHQAKTTYYPTTYRHHHKHNYVRHSNTYWSNWQPVYYPGKVRCEESCLVNRCSGKTVRCVKQCSRYCCGGY
ncbi:MAG: hypothetical protein H2069_00650 [Legionella sp.]|nr:hypothetical protein [Legionella sp.]